MSNLLLFLDFPFFLTLGLCQISVVIPLEATQDDFYNSTYEGIWTISSYIMPCNDITVSVESGKYNLNFHKYTCMTLRTVSKFWGTRKYLSCRAEEHMYICYKSTTFSVKILPVQHLSSP